MPKKQLGILLELIKSTYASTTERLGPLLEDGKITYDLLWVLFKPNTEIYATQPEIDQSRCARCNFGEERERRDRTKYFYVECRYLNWNGKLLGESTVAFEIEKFKGAKKISLLDAFPLRYLPTEREARTELIENGRKFISLRGTHHVQYQGLAFYRDSFGKTVSVSIDSRVVIDAAFFRKSNPNFFIAPLDVDSLPLESGDGFLLPPPPPPQLPNRVGEVKNAEVDVDEMRDEDLLICSPIVYGFSLKDKFWGEYADSPLCAYTNRRSLLRCREHSEGHMESRIILSPRNPSG